MCGGRAQHAGAGGTFRGYFPAVPASTAVLLCWHDSSLRRPCRARRKAITRNSLPPFGALLRSCGPRAPLSALPSWARRGWLPVSGQKCAGLSWIAPPRYHAVQARFIPALGFENDDAAGVARHDPRWRETPAAHSPATPAAVPAPCVWPRLGGGSAVEQALRGRAHGQGWLPRPELMAKLDRAWECRSVFAAPGRLGRPLLLATGSAGKKAKAKKAKGNKDQAAPARAPLYPFNILL